MSLLFFGLDLRGHYGCPPRYYGCGHICTLAAFRCPALLKCVCVCPRSSPGADPVARQSSRPPSSQSNAALYGQNRLGILSKERRVGVQDAKTTRNPKNQGRGMECGGWRRRNGKILQEKNVFFLWTKKQQQHLTPNTMMRKLGSFDLFFLGLHFPPRSRTCDRYSPSAQSGKRFL